MGNSKAKRVFVVLDNIDPDVVVRELGKPDSSFDCVKPAMFWDDNYLETYERELRHSYPTRVLVYRRPLSKIIEKLREPLED